MNQIKTRVTLNPELIIFSVLIFITLCFYFWSKQQLNEAQKDQGHPISIKVGGVVQNLYISDQQKVKQGELLFELDPIPFQEKHAQAKIKLIKIEQEAEQALARVDTAKATVLQQQAELRHSQAMLDSTKLLFEKKLVSNQVLKDSILRVELSKAALEVSQALLKEANVNAFLQESGNEIIHQAKEELARAKWALEQVAFFSPSDGVVSQLKLEPGQVLLPHQPVFLLKIAEK